MSGNTEAKALAAKGREELREAQENAIRAEREPDLVRAAALAASGIPEGLLPWARAGHVSHVGRTGQLMCRVDLEVAGFAPVSRLLQMPPGGEWRPDSSWLAKGRYVPTLAMALAVAEDDEST